MGRDYSKPPQKEREKKERIKKEIHHAHAKKPKRPVLSLYKHTAKP